MRTLYVEGVATHDGPESCVDVRDGGEALTGVRAVWAIEPRNQRGRGADAVERCGRPHRRQRFRELPTDSHAVEQPVDARNLHAGEPGDPAIARLVDREAGRSGKAKAVILR